MKILIAHNYYQQKGGEDSVVNSEIELLREHGNTVHKYFVHNDDIGNMSPLSVALRSIWSRTTKQDLSNICDQFFPDVIHVHNTMPLISPSIFWFADRYNIPIVYTLHNYRLGCLQAMFLKDGVICEECIGRIPISGVFNKCYRDSIAASSVMALTLMFHRLINTYANKVDRFIALTDFGREKYVEIGLPASKIAVKPNFISNPNCQNNVRQNLGLFVGRLSSEKGVNYLLEALKLVPQARVRVIGDGPLRAAVEMSEQVEFLGWQSPVEVYRSMRECSYLVMPSTWYEGFPRTLVEAFAHGLPVLASRIGALEESIGNNITGLLFEPANSKDLSLKIQYAQENLAEMESMGERAFERYHDKYSPDVNYNQLMTIYDEAIVNKKKVS